MQGLLRRRSILPSFATQDMRKTEKRRNEEKKKKQETTKKQLPLGLLFFFYFILCFFYCNDIRCDKLQRQTASRKKKEHFFLNAWKFTRGARRKKATQRRMEKNIEKSKIPEKFTSRNMSFPCSRKQNASFDQVQPGKDSPHERCHHGGKEKSTQINISVFFSYLIIRMCLYT